MKKINKEELLSLPSVSNEENVYFKHFDYINPTVLKTEFGIANEFKQYSRCAKVKRLLGGDSSGDGGDGGDGGRDGGDGGDSGRDGGDGDGGFKDFQDFQDFKDCQDL